MEGLIFGILWFKQFLFFSPSTRRSTLSCAHALPSLNLKKMRDCSQSKGLFTRREGYPCARVTLASGLKLALI